MWDGPRTKLVVFIEVIQEHDMFLTKLQYVKPFGLKLADSKQYFQLLDNYRQYNI